MRSAWRAVRLSFAVLVVVVGLGGCGQPADMSDVFDAGSSWNAEVPGDAEMLAAEEFYRRVTQGRIVITLVTDETDQANARDEAFVADLATLHDIVDPSPALTDLLEAAEGMTGHEPGTIL